MSRASRAKARRTMKRRYGVSSGWKLRRPKSSKGQLNFYQHLSHSLPDEMTIESEKRIGRYWADMVVSSSSGLTIVEYNGDYWHCNPKQYEASYYNQKKRKKASTIWKDDLKRKKKLQSLGFRVIDIWESDYQSNTTGSIEKIKEVLLG